MSQPLNRSKASGLTLAPISTSRQGQPISQPRRLKPAPTAGGSPPVAQSHTTPHPASATQLTTLEKRFLAFPSRLNALTQSHPNGASVGQPLRPPAIEGQTSVQAIETVLNVFHERMQADFKDFRSLCLSLVSQEQQAKDNWHKLCLKLMQERDVARRRVHALISEREMRNGKLPPPETAVTASSSGKRSRDDDALTTSNLSSKSSEPRQIRRLRVSSAGSSTSSSGSSTPPPITPDSATLPPDSAISTTPLTPFSTTTPMSDLPPIPFSINPVPDFCKIKPAKSPGDSTSIDCTAVGARPQKRRKSESCEDASPQSLQSASTTLSIKHSPSPKPTDISFNFSDVDIMYAPLNDQLACRPCLLRKQNSHFFWPYKPMTFPTTTPWDDLRQHCVVEHPDACADLARLHPAEIHELRRRLYSPK